jgi:hypothetical protein
VRKARPNAEAIRRIVDISPRLGRGSAEQSRRPIMQSEDDQAEAAFREL